ncbi:MAG TPA: hypothetical protein VGL88_01635 [Pseudonocardiaceae bacterium]
MARAAIPDARAVAAHLPATAPIAIGTTRIAASTGSAQPRMPSPAKPAKPASDRVARIASRSETSRNSNTATG